VCRATVPHKCDWWRTSGRDSSAATGDLLGPAVTRHEVVGVLPESGTTRADGRSTVTTFSSAHIIVTDEG